MKRYNRIFPGVIALSFALVLPSVASAEEWPGSFLARVEATALVETLNAELLSNPSATLTLERWCGAHHLAAEAKVSAHLVRGEDKQITPEDRQRYDDFAYRHRLKKGEAMALLLELAEEAEAARAAKA